MKRVICSILFLCSLILIISGCKSNETSFSNVNESTDDLKVEGENYSILIYGASDSIEQANHSIEYPMWSKNFFIDPNAPQFSHFPPQQALWKEHTMIHILELTIIFRQICILLPIMTLLEQIPMEILTFFIGEQATPLSKPKF